MSDISYNLTAGFPQGIVSSPSPPIDTSILSTLGRIADTVAGAANAYYQTAAQIEAAKAQVAIAKAQGQNAVQVAKTGNPSNYLLLWGALGIGAVYLFTRRPA